MATNTFKIPTKSSERGSFFSAIGRFLSVDDSLSSVIHVRFLPQILFGCFLCVIYIGSRHHAEKKIRSIGRLEIQVEDLRADFTTLKADFKYESKQSEVAKKAEALGLSESASSPYKIVIPKE
ncbi:MAG: hypothetical protein JXR10_03805 [Cyclobacteriaceae bacterium]